MKKYLLTIGLVVFFIRVITYILGISPFTNISVQVEKDYVNHETVFIQFIIENDGSSSFMTKDTYDKSIVSTCKLFEDLQYQFIRVGHDNVFFCKGYDGMSGIGLLYSETSFTPNLKQKAIKILDENWMIISEHNL